MSARLTCDPSARKQIWEWLYDKRVNSFEAMSNLPRATILKLNAIPRDWATWSWRRSS